MISRTRMPKVLTLQAHCHPIHKPSSRQPSPNAGFHAEGRHPTPDTFPGGELYNLHVVARGAPPHEGRVMAVVEPPRSHRRRLTITPLCDTPSPEARTPSQTRFHVGIHSFSTVTRLGRTRARRPDHGDAETRMRSLHPVPHGGVPVAETPSDDQPCHGLPLDLPGDHQINTV